MTSLTPHVNHPPHDTPVVRTLEPGYVVLATDVSLQEAEEVAVLMENTVWCHQHGIPVLALGGYPQQQENP
jgi:hypothetical protein